MTAYFKTFDSQATCSNCQVIAIRYPQSYDLLKTIQVESQNFGRIPLAIHLNQVGAFDHQESLFIKEITSNVSKSKIDSVKNDKIRIVIDKDVRVKLGF